MRRVSSTLLSHCLILASCLPLLECLFSRTVDYYKEIDKHLTENVHSDDFESNMMEAHRLLAINNDQRQTKFVEALKQFKALEDIVSDCGPNSYKILLKNDEATKGRNHRLNAEPKSRIDRILNTFLKLHAQYCRRIYPLMFETRYKQLDKEKVNMVETFLSQEMNLFPFGLGSSRSREEHIQDMLSVPAIRSPAYAKAALKAIKILKTATPNPSLTWSFEQDLADNIVTKENVESLFAEYIIGPCQYYTRELDDVIVPASYEFSMLDEKDRYEVDSMEFYFGWAIHRQCNLLLNNDQKFLLKELKRLVS